MTGAALFSGRSARHVCFIAGVVVSLIVFRTSLADLIHLALYDERYSYVALIPFISASIIYLKKHKAFRESSPSRIVALSIASIALILYWSATVHKSPDNQADMLVLFTASLVLVWLSSFFFCYGLTASKQVAFPLVFLFLIVPPPPYVMNEVAVWLQKSSAEVSYVLFKLTGVPVLRQGFVFALPGLNIEIAEQCSGIRSTLSLFIASMIAGHLLLQSTWKKICLSLLAIPIVITKNALRIVVLSLLGAYVDRDVLFGKLHTSSGLLFSPLALLVLGWLLVVLYRSEKHPLVKG